MKTTMYKFKKQADKIRSFNNGFDSLDHCLTEGKKFDEIGKMKNVIEKEKVFSKKNKIRIKIATLILKLAYFFIKKINFRYVERKIKKELYLTKERDWLKNANNVVEETMKKVKELSTEQRKFFDEVYQEDKESIESKEYQEFLKDPNQTVFYHKNKNCCEFYERYQQGFNHTEDNETK